MFTSSTYRLRQFFRAIGVRPSAADLLVVDRLLTDAERRLFDRTSPRDQHHHLQTVRLLRGGGPSLPLARAALLHDVGKGRIRLHERVLYVLLAAGAPALLRLLTRRERPGLLGALYRTRHHAPVGASLLAALGADPRTVELVARHHDVPAGDTELRDLIDADERA